MKKVIAIFTSILIAIASLPLTVYAEWKTENNRTYYLDETSSKVTGWQTIDGKKYYFSSDGTMKTGWLTMKSGNKYYFKKDGSMVTGWLKSGQTKYYFKKNGVMATGSTKIGKKIYQFDDNGKYIKQLKYIIVDIGDKKYSLDKDGNLCTNVMEGVEDSYGNVTYYYFGKNGYAITTTKTIDGITYEFDAEKGLIDAYVNIKVGKFNDKHLKLSNFKIKNESGILGNSVKYSGSIKNICSETLKIFVYATFYDADGNVIDDSQIIACSHLKPGESYKFNSSRSIDGVAYKIEFTDIAIYKA